MGAIRTNWVAWLVLGHFTDTEFDPEDPDQPNAEETALAGSIALSISGAAARDAQALSTRQMALVLAQLVRDADEDGTGFEPLVADRLDGIAELFEAW